MVFFMIAIIVLCSLYELFRNREIAAQREHELEMEKSKGTAVQDDTAGKTEGDLETPRTGGAETERNLLNPEPEAPQPVDLKAEAPQPIENGGAAQPKASRVQGGDHSVIQDDEDFSDEGGPALGATDVSGAKSESVAQE